ncbi:hypothetical protein chiPu_0025945, partial [Chiloscyllium punctatum]|nr:hypothetical protein [Chiloscyllium punctatum]
MAASSNVPDGIPPIRGDVERLDLGRAPVDSLGEGR